MKPKLMELFNLVPKAKFEVRQTEKFREASASAEYNQSAPDGSRPGIFYVPVVNVKKFNVVGMEDLFLHEAIPGHHYQTSIQQENDSLPKFDRDFRVAAPLVLVAELFLAVVVGLQPGPAHDKEIDPFVIAQHRESIIEGRAVVHAAELFHG